MEATGTGSGHDSGDGSDGSASPLVGRLLDDRYRLDSVIARGGMASVFLATDTRLDRPVAVKVMHRALAEDPEFVARFTREAKASARLSAAEVVAVHDYGTDRTTGLAYLVMEHVRGITLRQLLLDRGPLSPSRAVALLEPVLRALAVAHAAGLIHRDIKPENVLLADDGRVKVADFGLARAIETSNLTQTTGLLIGTVAYLAPEQVESGAADARTDVYAAGVLLWELLTGTPPYSGDSPLSVAFKHVHEDMPPPSSARPGIPPQLDALVVRATRRDPSLRPQSGAAFLAELQAVAAGLPATFGTEHTAAHQTLVVPRPVMPTRAAPPVPDAVVAKGEQSPSRRRRGLIALIGLLVLALLALGGGYYLGTYRYTTAPGVLKLDLAAATARLHSAGLKERTGPSAFSEDIAKGLVIRQDPRPGGRVRKGGTVTLVLSKGKDRRGVPALAGQPLAAAIEALQKVGLTPAPSQPREYSRSVPTGSVTRTDPAAGTPLKPGTPVTLYVSRGPEPVAVPVVTGKQQAEAQRILSASGFQITVTQAFSDTVASGVVISQQPAGGTAARGSTVTLTVSKGQDLVVVPDVRGDQADVAEGKLRALGFQTSRQTLPGGPGVVIQTSPSHGKKARRGSLVTVYVF